MSNGRDQLPRPFSRGREKYPVFVFTSSAAVDLVSEWIDTLCGAVGRDLEGGLSVVQVCSDTATLLVQL